MRGESRLHGDHLGKGADLADRQEGGGVVEGQAAQQRVVHDVRRSIPQQRGAIGCGARDLGPADRSAGAGAVFDDEGGGQLLAHPRQDGARGRIRRRG